jgi:hypothetical protein
VLSFDALALDPGGDIFALAILSDRVHIAVVRLSPAGALRTGYGAAGFALLPENTAGDLLAIGSGQVLVSTAATSQQTGSTPALRRLRADGSVDPAYGGSGTVHPAGTRLVRAASGGVDVLSEFGDGGNRVTRLGIDGAVIRPTVTLRQGFGGGAFGAPARSPATVTFRPARAAGLGSFDVNAAVARPDGGLLLGGDAEVAVDDGGAGFVDSGSWGLESLRPDLSPDPGFGSRSGVSASLRLRHGSPRAAARRGSGVPISTGMTQRGEIEVRITARRGGRTITVANRTVVFLAATSARPLRIPVTLAGRRLLQRSGSVRVTVRGLATIVGGESRTLPRRSLTLR